VTSGVSSPADTPWITTAAGSHLRGRLTRDTHPERAPRQAIHARGLRFRLGRRIDGYRPDFVLPRHRLAVFVDGCFWHGCPEHGPSRFRGPNADRWRRKLATNRSRDQNAVEALTKAGWRVLRVWERDIHSGCAGVADKVVTAVSLTDELAG
jgi:DNA mismatch endonuclease, patch repair protein